MGILRVNNITKEYGIQNILSNVNIEIEPNDKLGLIGANGTGKTTLIRLILGLEAPTDGSIIKKHDVRIGYVPQHVEFSEDQDVESFLLSEFRGVEAELRACEHELAQHVEEDSVKIFKKYERIRLKYDQIDGDHYESRAKRMLTAFGLLDKLNQNISVLSGGEKNIIAITRALLIHPDLLILDEPANHLDYKGIAWLEDFLKRYNGAILIVSHNRYLLDQTVNGILDLANAKITRYRGNYSDYRIQKLQEKIRQEKEYKSYQRKLDKLEEMVERISIIAKVHSDKSWGRRLRSRQSQLDKVGATGVAAPEKAMRKAAIRFEGEATKANIVLRMRDYKKAYDDRVLLENVNIDITSGERIALVGPNGIGKTSLLRDIMESGHWGNPVIRLGPTMRIGYCAQQQETLTDGNTIFEEMMCGGANSNQGAREILARFLFNSDDLEKKVKNLSGGERNRLQLARVILQKPNVLILDEPTNHLDIQTREAVEEALDDYPGTLLVVSHDRYFLDKLVDRVLEIKDQKLLSFPGSYTEFWYNQKQELEKAQEAEEAKKAQAVAKPKNEKPRKKGVNPWKLEQKEQEIAEIEAKIEKNQDFAVAAFADSKNEKGTDYMQMNEKLKEELEIVYLEWMELQNI